MKGRAVRRSLMIAVGACIALLTISRPGLATSPSEAPTPSEAPADKKHDSEVKLEKAVVLKLIYKPPNPGAPSGRVSGGTRDIDPGRMGMFPALEAIAPEDHAGLTGDSQPSLYWYISAPSSLPIRFTLASDRNDLVPREVVLPPVTISGLQCISLAEHDIQLEPHVLYRWMVTVGVDPDHPTSYRFAGGGIKRVPLSKELITKLGQLEENDRPAFYAEEGYWYDTVMGISQQIAVSPREITLRRQRASLFQQVGLDEAANWDLHRGRR